jgi:hypothetical protein
VEGVRDLARWDRHLSREPWDNRTIVDIGCSSAMDGILAVATRGARKLWGCDCDEASVRLGLELASAWRVQDRVFLHHQSAASSLAPPHADILFLFSVTQRIDPDTLDFFVASTRAPRIYLESHSVDDHATAAFLGRWKKTFAWTEIAKYPQSREGKGERLLYHGTREEAFP